MTVQPNEAVVLVIALAGYIPVIEAYFKNKGLKMFFLAYTALIVKFIVTVLEGFIYRDALNFVEHGVGIGLAGILFFLTAYFSSQRIQGITDIVEEKVGKQ